jgi:hypothetical protein
MRDRAAILSSLAICIAAVGCWGPAPDGRNVLLSPERPPEMDASEPSLLGRWESHPRRAALHPVESRSARTTQYTLDLLDDSRYRFGVDGLPIEGRYRREGRDLVFEAETFLGKPLAEAEWESTRVALPEQIRGRVLQDGLTVELELNGSSLIVLSKA